ncbi:MAG: LacI family DNA-binding transcriptional regulator [Anaerolineae bacterium]|nr:LacI family DNA-binding transcriptional regulator [Anaerolineae bacterium]
MSRDEKKPKAPTIFDIARKSGVSYSTVSRALSGYEFVKSSTREKVLQAARELEYVPNQQARSLAGGRSNMIGVLVPDLSNSYISEIIHGIDDELAKSDYNIILYTTHRHQGKESEYVATMVNSGADGLLLVVPLISSSYLDALHQQDFPYVLLDQMNERKQSLSVIATNRAGAYEATQYLIELGHRHIGFISGLEGLNSATERLAGYKTALSDHGIHLDSEYIVGGDFRVQGGYLATQKLLSLQKPPTAIFASNDMSAFGAIEAIRQHGLHIPDDISVLGFDDLSQASLVYPKLTTVHQPLVEMGREAVIMLLECIEYPAQEMRQTILPTKLIIRDSCAPPAIMMT